MSALDEAAQAVGLPDDGAPAVALARGSGGATSRSWLPVLARVVAAAFPVAILVSLSATRPRGFEIALLWLLWSFVIGYTSYAVWLRPLAPRLPLAALASGVFGFVAASLLAFLFPSIPLTAVDALAIAGATFGAAAAIDLRFAPALSSYPRILFVGVGEAGSALIDELSKHPTLRPRSVRVVDDETPEALAAIIAADQPDLVVAARDATELVQSILDMGLVHVRVISLHGFYEHVVGRVPLAELSPIWFMSVLHMYQRPYSRFMKRAFDFVGAVLGAVCLSPLLAVGVVLVRLSGPGPILYRQVRLGAGGRPFQIVKFRTMVNGAEAPGIARWAAANDSRITRAGRILRRSHIDELPQLWNVLRGEMSLVGPRPERPEFLGMLEHELPLWTRRHLVTPGLTGWAQVQTGYAADVASAAEKLSYDLYYLKHRSVALDLAILMKTLAVVLGNSPGWRPVGERGPRPLATIATDLLPHGDDGGVARSNGRPSAPSAVPDPADG